MNEDKIITIVSAIIIAASLIGILWAVFVVLGAK